MFTKSELPSFKKFVAEAYILATIEKATIGYIVNDRFEVRIGDQTSRN